MRKAAGVAFIILSMVMVVVHLLIIFGVLPFTIIWGGSIQDVGQLYPMEVVAISVLIAFAVIQAKQSRILKIKGKPLIWKILSIVVLLYLILNTLGNFASGVKVEKILFGSITLIMVLLSLIILKAEDRGI